MKGSADIILSVTTARDGGYRWILSGARGDQIAPES